MAAVTLFITCAIRIFRNIKLSKTGSKILWIAFIVTIAEGLFWGDFEFFNSQLVSIPYYSIFSIAIAFDILIRTYHALVKSRGIVHHSVLIENAPIKRLRYDKTKRSLIIVKLAEEIRRSRFQMAYSIGITGDWGIGKTSFIEPLKDELRNDSIVISFNPWLPLGRKSVLQSFAEALSNELSKYDYDLSSELNKYVTSLIKMEANSNTNFLESLSYAILGQSQDPTQEFASIDRSLRRMSKKIIVFIDDLDRLDAGEIAETLKLIRNTANFGNIIYISCYDKIYLLHAIQTSNKRNLNIALDKFFDLEIPVSPISGAMLINKIKSDFLNEYSEISQSDAKQIVEHLSEFPIFFQFREVNKFLSSLKLNFSIYGSKLFLQDFFFLEFIKVKYPSIVQLLWRQKDDFITENLSNGILELRVEDSSLPEEKQVLIIRKYLTENEQNEYNRLFLTDLDINTIARLMVKMFSMGKGHPLAIKEPDAFNAYFYHEIPESLIDETNLDRILRENKFRESAYFKESFDSKKESDLESLLKDKNYFIDDNSSRFDFSDFFLKLISWSKGTVNAKLLYDYYEKAKLSNVKEHFEKFITKNTNSTTELYARTLFLANQIRTLIYNSENDYGIEVPKLLDKENLIEINFILFKRFLQQSKNFSNHAFATLYNQVEHIESTSRTVIITEGAMASFKQFINDHKAEYLDLNIRSGMRPNYDITFVFEPLTFRIFNSKGQFIEFVNSSELPKRRKDKIIEYLEKANKNSNSIEEFSLEEADLKSMPIEFKNAWSDITQETKRKARLVISYVNWLFKNQPPPNDYPERNDNFYDEVLSLKLHSLQIDVEPGETKYWRLGFSFTKTAETPRSIGGRHHDPKRADVHLTVGSQENKEWALENQVSIKEYHISPTKSEFIPFTRYKGEKLKITLLPIAPHSEWSIQITHKENILGERRYNLAGYNFVTISAWCDGREFNLNTTITLIQPVDLLQSEEI
jgi:hypothetical protein